MFYLSEFLVLSNNQTFSGFGFGGRFFFKAKTLGPNEVISAYKVAKKRPVDDYMRRVKDGRNLSTTMGVMKGKSSVGKQAEWKIPVLTVFVCLFKVPNSICIWHHFLLVYISATRKMVISFSQAGHPEMSVYA